MHRAKREKFAGKVKRGWGGWDCFAMSYKELRNLKGEAPRERVMDWSWVQDSSRGRQEKKKNVQKI